MHLRDVQSAGAPLIQGLVKTEWPSGAELQSGRVASWSRLFLASVALWSQFRTRSVAVRLAFTPGRPLTSVHSFVADKTEETRLRMVLAAFLRTDRIASGLTECPLSADDLEAGYLQPHHQRVGVAYEALATGDGHSLNYNVRLAELLPELIASASSLGVPCAFEMQATSWTPSRDVLRRALYAAAHLQDSGSAPPRLLADQMALADRVKRSTWHVEECLATAGAADALVETMSHVLEGTIYGELGAAPRVEPIGAARARAFAQQIHSRILDPNALGTEAEDLGAAATRDDVERALACRGVGLPDIAPRAPAGPTAAGPVPFAGRAPPDGPAAGSPYLFVSYARADQDRVYPVVDRLQQQGVSLWIDRRLLAGDEWLDELETRINGCCGVLAFISQAFDASRYCGREVRYADALERRIIPLYLDATILTGGLRLILQPVQFATLVDEAGTAPVLAAIQRHASIAMAAHNCATARK